MPELPLNLRSGLKKEFAFHENIFSKSIQCSKSDQGNNISITEKDDYGKISLINSINPSDFHYTPLLIKSDLFSHIKEDWMHLSVITQSVFSRFTGKVQLLVFWGAEFRNVISFLGLRDGTTVVFKGAFRSFFRVSDAIYLST